jgi:hypothetical protein
MPFDEERYILAAFKMCLRQSLVHLLGVFSDYGPVEMWKLLEDWMSYRTWNLEDQLQHEVREIVDHKYFK